MNERGESIVGQPDSYVGDTANACSIAFCYTVQRRGWWNKVVEDVVEARAAAPFVSEIVIAIPHNADRDGPTRGNPDWRSLAAAAAGAATIRVVDGREIAQRLDHDDQDLRFTHLGISYSRLGPESLLDSAQRSTAIALDAMVASGRFDPSRYSRRSADEELYRLWQECLRDPTTGSVKAERASLIPLVNDSGVGKTSLVCAFARSLDAILPVVLVQARNLSFDTEDALVAYVLQSLQGVLDSSMRLAEEAALVRHLATTAPLTVIVDGLDETHMPDEVRRAITFWLRSRIGAKSVLIVTSRPEFWRVCQDEHWVRWVGKHRRTRTDAGERDFELDSSRQDARLPDLFTPEELEAAWDKAGRSRLELFALSGEARTELRHPFTLRVYLDLCVSESSPPPILSRVDLMDRWLSRRLESETSSALRISRDMLQQSLRTIATLLAGSTGGAISVDSLSGLPRFDPRQPPGPVVQRLLDASILESVPSHPDYLRFRVEAVQDFFRADAEVEEIVRDPLSAAERLSSAKFSAVYARLLRISRHLVSNAVRNDFVRHLALRDAAMAAVLIIPEVAAYDPEIRTSVAKSLGHCISARHRVRAAFAITLLGYMNCPESAAELRERLFPPASAHRFLNAIGSSAFVYMGRPEAAEFIFRWDQFAVYSGNDAHYFKEEVAKLRGASQVFRSALGDVALRHADAPSGDSMHARVVYVLASLGDECLVTHLEGRMLQNGGLLQYENHALIALGSDAASKLFTRSVEITGAALAKIGDKDNQKWNEVGAPLHFYSSDLRHLMTPAFRSVLSEFVHSDNRHIAWHAGDIIRRSRSATLFLEMAKATASQGWTAHGDFGERNAVTPELWLTWWADAGNDAVRQKIIRLAPRRPSVEVESKLIECLSTSAFRGIAAHLLGEYGSVRALPQLRRCLSDDLMAADRHTLYDKWQVGRAVGDLHDTSSVPLLEAVAAAHPRFEVEIGVEDLGVIGTPEAEQALFRLLEQGGRENPIVSALIACGTPTAMAEVVRRAESRDDGVQWLCERMRWMNGMRGGPARQYVTHVYADGVIAFLQARVRPGVSKDNWDLVHAFERMDSPAVRAFLKALASIDSGSGEQAEAEEKGHTLYRLCMEQLVDRGDEFAVKYVLDDRHEEKRDDIYVHLAANRLKLLDGEPVTRELRLRLANARSSSQIIRYVALLGRFGTEVDSEHVKPFVDHTDDDVANVACEAYLRLTDPLRVPEIWREV